MTFAAKYGPWAGTIVAAAEDQTNATGGLGVLYTISNAGLVAQYDVGLKVEDIAPNGYAIDRATVRQKKTGRPVKFELTDPTRQAVDDSLLVKLLSIQDRSDFTTNQSNIVCLPLARGLACVHSR